MAKLVSNLTHIARRAPELAGETLLQTAEDIFALSQGLVPVDTGLLKASGGTDIEEFNAEGDPTTVIVGYGKEGSQREDVALYIEFGTVKMSPQPYLVPSFSQSEETFEKRLSDAMQKVNQ